MASSIAGCEVTIMKGLGHFPMSENPEAFLDAPAAGAGEDRRELSLRRWACYLFRGGPALRLPERGVDLGHGGAAIGFALAVEPLLMGAEIGDARLDLGLEFPLEVRTSDRGRA